MYILPSLQFTAHYPSITWGLNRSSSFLQSDCHQSVLMKLLTEEIGCEKQNILDFDLHLADNQPAVSTVFLKPQGRGVYFLSSFSLMHCLCIFTDLGRCPGRVFSHPYCYGKLNGGAYHLSVLPFTILVFYIIVKEFY